MRISDWSSDVCSSDLGVALAFGSDRANYAALAGASIASGSYDTCLAEGMIRLGGAPEGRVTCDFRGDAANGVYVATAGGIFRRIVTNRLGALNIRSEEHTSELQSLMRISYAVFCLKKNNIIYISNAT